jgi:hypothetical protein
VAPCILASDTGSFGYYQDIGVAPGPNGCNCKWNGGWCGQLSIDTMAWIAFLMLHDVPEAAVDDLCFAEARPRMRRLFPADDLCDILRSYTSRHSCKWLGCRRHGYVSPLRLQRGLLWVTCRLHMHRHLLERSHNGYMQCTAVFAPHCISWRSRCITTLRFLQACPPGYYCPGDGNYYVCPAGTFGSSYYLTSSSCSGSCLAGYYCGAGSTSSTGTVTRGLRGNR